MKPIHLILTLITITLFAVSCANKNSETANIQKLKEMGFFKIIDKDYKLYLKIEKEKDATFSLDFKAFRGKDFILSFPKVTTPRDKEFTLSVADGNETLTLSGMILENSGKISTDIKFANNLTSKNVWQDKNGVYMPE